MSIRRLLAVGLLLAIAACSSNPAKEQDRMKSAQVNAELGLRYMLQGKNELALQKLERALEFNPDSAPAHHYSAELYRRLGRPEKAREHYREAVRAAPDDSALRNNYGVFLCGQGDFAEAERQFLKVLENPVYSRRDEVYENLGLCLRRKPDLEKAEGYFRQALQINPKLPKSLQAMAELSHRAGKLLSARAYLQRYQEVAPPTPETLWLGVQVERRLGDREAARSYGRLLQGNYPDSQEAALYRASEKEKQRK